MDELLIFKLLNTKPLLLYNARKFISLTVAGYSVDSYNWNFRNNCYNLFDIDIFKAERKNNCENEKRNKKTLRLIRFKKRRS